MKKLIVAFVAFALVATAACGKDGEELLGVWRVTTHDLDEVSCGEAAQPVVDGPPYIKFIEGEFFGQEYLEYVACSDPTTCEGSGGIFFGLLYAESIDDGMRAVIYVASGSGDDCTLSATISNATAPDGMLRIETRMRMQGNVTGTTCEADDAEDRADSMPCVRYEVITGVHP
jgi:hypothetical protein